MRNVIDIDRVAWCGFFLGSVKCNSKQTDGGIVGGVVNDSIAPSGKAATFSGTAGGTA
jgi:hypothetical protein